MNKPVHVASPAPKSTATFEQLTKLAELAASRLDARREYEWKITLGFWLAMLTALHKDWQFPRGLGVYWYVALVAGFSLTWPLSIFVANNNDKKRYEQHIKEAEGLLGASTPAGTKWIWGFWAQVFQVGVTAVIAALIYLAKAA